MKPSILVMNFSRVYEHESFLKNRNYEWIDCTGITGTSCFCDDEARKIITEKIAGYESGGIHFIDSGNYHYVSLFWIAKIKEPFTLVVFDHHTDLQPSSFGDILSCGNWVREALETNPMIKKIVIAGASPNLTVNTTREYNERLIFYNDKLLKEKDTLRQFEGEKLSGPVYISIDKDVLDTGLPVTNWDNGTLSLAELKKLLSVILKNQRVIGVDICGELTYSDDPLELLNCESLNNEINRELCRVIKKYVYAR
jgi:arginase family enzyme